MYRRNSKGPRAVPCGTQGGGGEGLDGGPSSSPCWLLFRNKALGPL